MFLVKLSKTFCLQFIMFVTSKYMHHYLSRHEMKIHPIYFLHACYRSNECLNSFWPHSFFIKITKFNLPVKRQTCLWGMLDFSIHLIFHLNFLTSDCRLAFRSASIQSTIHGLKQVLDSTIFDSLFHSNVNHNTEEKICHYYSFIDH